MKLDKIMFTLLAFCLLGLSFSLGVLYSRTHEQPEVEQCLSVCADLFDEFGC